MPDTVGGIPMPPYAYVPGQNARHPEDWFDGIKAGVQGDIVLEDLHCTQAWHAGMIYFKAGFFWECHEVLEAVWMRTPDPSVERDMVQAIIQLANARLKLRMKRPRATLRLCAMVRGHLARCPQDAPTFGMHVWELIQWTVETESAATA